MPIKKPRVAIVDGHHELSLAYKSRLAIEGYDSIIFNTGESALSYVRDVPVELVLMEIDLVDMSGLDVIDIFKSDPITSHIPIVVLTNNASLDISRVALRLGGEEYLIKSTASAHDTVDKINKLLLRATSQS
ncbi:MAG: response regulator [Patescibacteria group bacterium]|nr:response regulator [Patescibacteria group bacterium]